MTAPLTASAKTHPCWCVKTHSPMVNRTHIHHIHPLSMGGPDTPANRIPLCPTTHGEVHLILEHFARGDRKRRASWGKYAYALAVRGWRKAHPEDVW